MEYCIKNNTCEDEYSYNDFIIDNTNEKRDDTDDAYDYIYQCYFINEDKYIDRLDMHDFGDFNEKIWYSRLCIICERKNKTY